MTAYSLLNASVNELQHMQNYDIDFELIVNRLEELYAQIKPLVNEYKDKKPSEQALKIWTERYFMTYTDGKKDTSLDDAIRRIARSIAAADVNYAQTAEQLHRLEEIYYNIFSARLMLLNSPALFNLGSGIPKHPYFTKEKPTLDDYRYIFEHMDRRKTLHACYPMDIDDDLTAIFNTLKDAALISAAGGGIGINFSKLRPKYSRINTAGFSSGSISFMQLFDTMGAIILQGGKRRFAGMATHGFADWQISDFWDVPVSFHPDIIDFIHSKEHNTGESMLSRFNISVGINNSHDFLNAIKEGRDIPLSFMGKRMSEIVFDAHKDRIKDTVNARELFDDIVKLAWKTGDPGLVFWDKVNKFNPARDIIPMLSVNPCITADTWIDTVEGPRQVKDLIGKPFIAVINGEQWSSDKRGFFFTGIKPVYKIKTKEGLELKATEDHLILIQDGNNQIWKEVRELTTGDKLVRNNILTPTTVTEIEYIGYEPVYDAHILHKHMFSANGIIVHNCGEKPAISSYKYNIITPCDLGSIDVYKFTTTEDVRWNELLAMSQIGAYILDVLHELMMHPVNAVKKGVLLFRDIGLGFFGLAGALIKLYIPYSNVTAQAYAYGIMKTIEVGATKMSRFLGKIKGTYLMAPYIDKSIYVAQVWYKEHPSYEIKLKLRTSAYDQINKVYQEERKYMKQYGNSIYRNFVRTSVAPTGTISILAQTEEDGDVGSGIEPIYAYKYKRYVVSKDNQSKEEVIYKTKLLRFARNVPISVLDEWLDTHDTFEGFYSQHDNNYCLVESVFASAHTVFPMAHLNMLEAVQWACSNGVSKTINLKNDATVEDVAEIYEAALRSPVIKGITIYRDGSLDTQVLVSSSHKKKKPQFTIQEIKLNTVTIDKEDDSTWKRHAKGFLLHPETGKAVCPVCHSEILFKEGCISCSNQDCGWSACS